MIPPHLATARCGGASGDAAKETNLHRNNAAEWVIWFVWRLMRPLGGLCRRRDGGRANYHGE
jgi:hypothetical protein